MSDLSASSNGSDTLMAHVRRRLTSARPEPSAHSTPFVTLSYAQSLDGSIAAVRGQSLQLSNLESQRMTHQLRALHDAILIGINTVLSDDPRLNVRLVDGKSPQPIIVDTHLRFPRTARLLRDPCIRPVIVTSDHACEAKARELVAAGAQILRMPAKEDGTLDMAGVLHRVRGIGFQTVMIEGGARIITSVLASRLADQLVLTIAPTFVGGVRSVEQVEDGDRPMPLLEQMHVQ